MQYSRVSPFATRLVRLATSSTTTTALRSLSQVRNLHIQAPAALYTVGNERLR